MAYSPLGQGKRNTMFSEQVVVSLAKKYHKTPAQILLRYLTQKQIIVIPKSKHIQHIKENIDIFDFKMTDQELQAVESLDKNQPMIGKPENPAFVEMAMKW